MIQQVPKPSALAARHRLKAGGAAREDLLPLGRGRIGRHARDDGDDGRRPQQARALGLEPRGRRRLLVLGQARLQQDAAEGGARLALEHDEAPGLQLLVVGHAGGRGQDRLELVRAWAPARPASPPSPSGAATAARGFPGSWRALGSRQLETCRPKPSLNQLCSRVQWSWLGSRHGSGWDWPCGFGIAAAGGLHAFAALLARLRRDGRARANEPASVVVVFDGSGSMWGIIEGLAAASSCWHARPCGAGSARSEPQTRVGLASFGHRRGDCADVEVMRPPEPSTWRASWSRWSKLNPRGRGPLTLGPARSRQVAAAGAGQAQPGADPRRCRQLPAERVRGRRRSCARPASWCTSSVSALKPEDLAKMACLPQMTGGRLFNAQTAEQIGAAVEEAMQLASSDAGSDRAPAAPKRAPAPGAGPSPATERRDRGETAGRCAARPLSARPAGAEDGAGQPDLALDRDAEGSPRRCCSPAGPRTRTCRCRPAATWWRRATGRSWPARPSVVADKGPTVVDVVLNAGTLRVRAQAQKSGAPLGDAIITRQRGGAGPRRPEGCRRRPPLAAFKGSEGVAPCRRAATSCASSRGWCAPSGRWWCRSAARAASTFRSMPRVCSSRRSARKSPSPPTRSSSASPRTTPTHPAAGARWRGRRHGRRSSCFRRGPTT